MLCLDARTGREIWRTPSPLGDMRGPVAVHEGRVFAVTAESWVVAYSARTGATLWGRPLNPADALGRPIAQNRTAPVPTRHGLLATGEDDRSNRGSMYLLDYETGKTIRKIPAKAYVYYRAMPTVFDDVLYSVADGAAAAVAVPSGRSVWREKVKARATSAAVVADGTLLYATSNGAKARNAATGKELWTGRAGGSGYLQPVPIVWDDIVLVNGPSMLGLDLATGKVRFEVKHATDRSRFERSQRQVVGGCSTPIIAGDLAYYGHDDTSVCAINKGGEVVWQYVVGTPIKTSPVVTGNLLFVHDLAGYLWCFTSAESGA